MARMTWTSPAVAAAAALLAATALPASVKPCRDASGRIIRCAEPKPAPKRCKDASGRFVRCPAPDASEKTQAAPAKGAPPSR